jgi:hypothetical protein
VADRGGSKLPWEQTQEFEAVTPDAPGGEQRSPLEAQQAAADAAGPLDEHPELLVGAAFAGGLILAQLLRRLGSDD